MTSGESPSSARPDFTLKQSAELDWWWKFLQTHRARERMHALYGARYYAYFHREMRRDENVIEFGCGPVPVLETMSQTNVLGVDTLAEYYQKLELCDGSIPMIPCSSILPNDRYGLALLVNVLDHADRPARLVSEAFRVLKEGGEALLYVHLGHSDNKHYSTTVGEVLSWIRAAGFDVVRQNVRQTEPFDPPAFVAVLRKVI